MRYYVSCAICLLITINIKAQEYLKPLNANINLPYIKSKNNIAQKTASITPLDLPVFDDFTYASKTPYPSNKIWADSNVYVNCGYGIAPLNIGVATFDGLNKKGYPYNMLVPVSNSALADTLTSLPINLKKKGAYVYDTTSHVFLSFYYQAEGNGETPEPKDSLCVDFFNPKNSTWKKVWGKAGYNPSATDTNFHFVKIAVVDSFYFDSLFKFRFRNKATLSGSLDHWHIDYVYMEKDFGDEDTLRADVCMAYKPSSFLKNYSTMPYRQYNSSEMATTLYNFFRSNWTSNKQARYKYRIYEKTNTVPLFEEDLEQFNGGIDAFVPNGYFNGIQAHSTITVTPFAGIPNVTEDSTYFRFEHITSSTGGFSTANDTVEHILKFTNYYAYDDGSAERAYQLTNVYGGKMAVRYKLNVADTLKAMNIFFNPVRDGQLVQGSSFRLCVWDGNGGSPGALIHKDSLAYPKYLQGGYNLSPTYELTTCKRLEVGTYYFGITQTTDQDLQIGFDINTNHKDALYYDIGNGWTQSAIKGSLMINPVLGCAEPPVGIKEIAQQKLFYLYPNPAQDYVHIKWLGNQEDALTVDIKNAIGETVVVGEIRQNQAINISQLPSGIYFIKATNSKRLNVSPQKLIISR